MTDLQPPSPPTSPPELFLVVLGGRLPGVHIELHDVRFVAGSSIEATLPELRRQWFGSRRGLHLDSWMRVRNVDGNRVELRREPCSGPERLWFVNMGGYDPEQLAEQHAFGLFVAATAVQARAAARQRLLPGVLERHRDDLHEVRLDTVRDAAGGEDGAWAVHLLPGGEAQPQRPDWFGYQPI
jgi:hypothetical protein